MAKRFDNYLEYFQVGYEAGCHAMGAWTVDHDSRYFRAEKLIETHQALANRAVDGDRFEMHLVDLGFECGWRDTEVGVTFRKPEGWSKDTRIIGVAVSKKP